MPSRSNVDREAQLRAVSRLLERAEGGKGAMMVLAGSLALDTSGFLDEAVAMAEGWRVVRLTGTTPGGTRGLGLVLTLLDQLEDQIDTNTSHGRSLTVLREGKYRSAVDIAWALVRQLEDLTKPLLIAVEDLHYADALSLRVIDELLESVDHLRIALIGTSRTDDPSAELLSVLSGVQVLSPTFVPVQSLPPRVEDDGVLADWLSTLSEEEHAVVRALAILESHATISAAAATAAVPVARVRSIIERLISEGLVIENGEVLRPAHSLVLASQVSELSADEQALWQSRAAAGLRIDEAPDGVIAHHLLATKPGQQSWVREALARRGNEALAADDQGTAAAYLSRALLEDPSPPAADPAASTRNLLCSLGEALAGLGQVDGAVSAWREAAQADEDTALAPLLRAAETLAAAGRTLQASELYAELLQVAEGPQWRQVAANMLMVSVLHGGVNVDVSGWMLHDLMEHHDEWHSSTSPTDPLAAAALLARRGVQAERTKRLADEALQLGSLIPLFGRGAQLAPFLATGLLIWTSGFHEAEAEATNLITRAMADGSSTAHAIATAMRGLTRIHTGDISGALLDFEPSLRADNGLWPLTQAYVLAGVVECRLARGERDEADRYQAALDDLSTLTGLTGGQAHLALGQLATAADDHAHASRHFRAAGRALAGVTENPALLSWRSHAAMSAIRLGDHPTAEALTVDEVRLARTFGSPYPLANALRTRASVKGPGDRASLLMEALEVLGGTPAARLRAQIETDLAGQLVLGGRPGASDQALDLLHRVERYAAAQELWPLLRRIDSLLRRLGEEPPDRPLPMVSYLSMAERRIAVLAALGFDDQQIAEQEFISTRAVAWHLSHVFRKFGIRKRSRLSQFLTEPTPPSQP